MTAMKYANTAHAKRRSASDGRRVFTETAAKDIENPCVPSSLEQTVVTFLRR
jgi:hypothetical protein